MNQFPGEAVEYYSADIIEKQTNPEHQYPIEFLNSLTIGELSPHKLSLKIHVIEAEIITKKYAGLYTFIPRITLSPSNINFPFTLKHRQFPVQPAFAMTINKSQGQSLNWVGDNANLINYTYNVVYPEIFQ
ncbi:uncharacterized protein OCT59_018028 [Rhizophagus irregularis]|uniref:uncharacterized protein n=1 Tax=Rhizophagus irregularis TaxID=588596 RepID=UPI00332F029D|nr:hypothetical protein OCT59_018028 [Rhizophagus irregularis]